MAVVIRLQGLPIVAGTMDIRHFFSGLTIPDGGVHIVGGDHGEAFIVFATDEDARLGMMRTGGSIKGSKVSLLLSSKTEMQNMIELSRRRFEAGTGAVEAAVPTPGNASRQSSSTPIPTAQPGTGGRSGQANQAFANTSASVTAASSSQEAPSNKAVASLANVAPTFPNSYSSSPSVSTALASLNAGPPPVPSLPSMPSMPSMPTLPTVPVPPTVSSIPSVPAVNPLPQGPPIPPMSHLAHMSSLPPFNPTMPPPTGLGSGLHIGNHNPMMFNPLTPLASLGLHAHMKVAAVANMSGQDEQYVHLQNLPFSCTEIEVREFFQGLGVDGIHFMRDAQGRLNGRAMVKFFSPQEGFEALKRGGGMMGQRFIEISPGSERQWATFGNSIIGQVQLDVGKSNNMESHDLHHRRGGAASRDQRARSRSPQRQEFCVYLKGLPYEVDKKQVKDFFKNLSVVEDSIYIAYGPNGRATGEGFVEFKTEQDYNTALGAHMQYMGSRFIQVHPISYKGMLDKIESIRKRQSSHSDGKNQDSKTPRNCAHITNIPYNISKKDVRAFLEGVGIYEDSLKVLVDSQGNGLGQAILQLQTEEDGRKAERLHRQKLNGRDAFIHLVTFDQMKEIERNPPPQNKKGQRNQSMQNQLNQSQHHQHHSQLQVQPTPQPPQVNPFAAIGGEEFSYLRNPMAGINNTPFVAPFSGPGNGLTGPPPLPPMGAGLGDLNIGVPPPLVAGVPGAPIMEPPTFRPGVPGAAPFNPDGLRGLVNFDNANRKGAGPTRAVGDNGNPGRLGGPSGGQQTFTSGAEALHNPTAPGASNSHSSQRDTTGPTIVKLQNMPFTVTADEIMDFFYGYQVLPGSVCLQFSDAGLPTGEAMVAFQNHEEASAAVMDLNDRPIGARKVKISLG
ncbi:copine-1 isoform 1-T2 [Synchiropus picturatus]